MRLPARYPAAIHPAPQGGAEHVEGEEPQPHHLGHPGDDAVDLAQSLDETGDGDHLAAVAAKEPLRGIQACGGEENVAAPSEHQRAATEMPDRKPDVVPGDRSEQREETQHNDV